MNENIEFAKWVAKQITLEVLEYNFSDDIWYLQSEYTDNKIIQFTTEHLFNYWQIKFKDNGKTDN